MKVRIKIKNARSQATSCVYESAHPSLPLEIPLFFTMVVESEVVHVRSRSVGSSRVLYFFMRKNTLEVLNTVKLNSMRCYGMPGS